MLDIVATIQAEQDEIIRAPLDALLTVQGGPGTGKTAVGLHRAAFLLYNHPTLSPRRRARARAPAEPSCATSHRSCPPLGEEAVVQTTIGDIAPKAKVRVVEPMEVRRVKADARMGQLLHRALQGRRRPLEEDVRLRVRFARATLGRERINALVASIVARPGPYKSGRLALRARLVSEARSAFRSSGRLGADEAWFEGELTSSEEFATLLDTLWPTVSPTTLVRDLLSSAGSSSAPPAASSPPTNGGCCSGSGTPRSRRRPGASTIWLSSTKPRSYRGSEPLVRAHRGGRGPGSDPDAVPNDRPTLPLGFDHGLGRSGSGHRTVDLRDWDEIRSHLPDAAVPHHDELTLGYRAPGRVLEFASRLLPVAAPGVRPTSSIRAGRSDPVVRTVPRASSVGLAGGSHCAGRRPRPGRSRRAGGFVPELTRLARRDARVGLLERDAMTRPMTIVAAPAAKGLEFDAVVVVEPAAIAGDDRRGLRLLYVAMTRPIQHLTIVHAQPLPVPLSADPAPVPYHRAHGIRRRRQGRPHHRREQRHR